MDTDIDRAGGPKGLPRKQRELSFAAKSASPAHL